MVVGDYTAKVHKEGPDVLNVDTGATLKVASVAVPASVTFAFAAAGTQYSSDCTISVLDGAGNAVTTPQVIDFWLSDAATGVGITGTAATGLTAESSGGVVLIDLPTKQHQVVLTLATGVYIAKILSTVAKTAWYVAVYLPSTGKTFVSRVMAAADYMA